MKSYYQGKFNISNSISLYHTFSDGSILKTKSNKCPCINFTFFYIFIFLVFLKRESNLAENLLSTTDLDNRHDWFREKNNIETALFSEKKNSTQKSTSKTLVHG